MTIVRFLLDHLTKTFIFPFKEDDHLRIFFVIKSCFGCSVYAKEIKLFIISFSSSDVRNELVILIFAPENNFNCFLALLHF